MGRVIIKTTDAPQRRRPNRTAIKKQTTDADSSKQIGNLKANDVIESGRCRSPQCSEGESTGKTTVSIDSPLERGTSTGSGELPLGSDGFKTRVAAYAVLGSAIGFAVLLAALWFIVPSVMGLRPFVNDVDAYPTIAKNTLGYADADTEMSSLGVGDLIVFDDDGTTRVSRVVEIGTMSSYVRTRGESSVEDDGVDITQENLIGRYEGNVPFFGLFLQGFPNLMLVFALSIPLALAGIMFSISRRGEANRERALFA